MIVDASTDLKIIGFYGKLNFKFVRKGLGEKVVGELQNKQKPKYKTVKMYFDLKEINRTTLL